jgi:hypothetical protein
MISVTVYRPYFGYLLAVVAILSLISLDSQQQFLYGRIRCITCAPMRCYFGVYSGLRKTAKHMVLRDFIDPIQWLIEVAQSYTGYRQAELMDLLANVTGIF